MKTKILLQTFCIVFFSTIVLCLWSENSFSQEVIRDPLCVPACIIDPETGIAECPPCISQIEAVVPEPMTLLMIGTGLVGLRKFKNSRRKA